MSIFALWLGETLLITTIFSFIFWLISPLFSKKPALQHLIWLIILVKFFTPPLFLGNASLGAMLVPREITHSEASSLPASPGLGPVSSGLNPFLSVTKAKLEPERAASPPSGVAGLSLDVEDSRGEIDSSLPGELSTDSSAEATTGGWNWYEPIWLSVLMIWISGAFLTAGYRLYQLLRIQAHLRVALPPTPELRQEIERLARQWNITPVRAVVIEGIEAPFLWCFGSLRLVWPQSLAQQDSTPTCVLAHELAHLKRNDHWTALLELAGDCIWWWNPVFWFVRKNLRQAAELACDHLAINLLPHERTKFAKFFLMLAERRQAAPAFPLLGISHDPARFFARRITMILSNDSPPRPGPRSWALAALAVGMLYPSWIFGDGRSVGPRESNQPHSTPMASRPEKTDFPRDVRQHPLIEPVYASQEPEYALLAFGPKSDTRVWMVRDGETLFIDKNGNGDLTDDGEKVVAQSRLPAPNLPLEQIPWTFHLAKLALEKYPTKDLTIRFYEPKALERYYFGPRKPARTPWTNPPSRAVCTIQCRTKLPQVPSQLEDGMAYLMAGTHDAEGFLEFSPRRETAPVLKIGTNLSLDVQMLENNNYLMLGQAARLSISVGFKGLGSGTFTSLHYQQTIPEAATPTVEVSLPAAKEGQFIKQSLTSSPNQFAWGQYAATILPNPSQGPGRASLRLDFRRWEGMSVEPIRVTFPVTAEIAKPNEIRGLDEIKLPFKVLSYAKPRDYIDTLKFSRDGKRIMASAFMASRIIQVWETSTCKQTAIIAPSNGPVPISSDRIECNDDLTLAYLSSYKMLPLNPANRNERTPSGGEIRIVDLASGKDLKSFKVPDRFAPERLVVAPGDANFLTVEWESYDTQTQRQKRPYQTMLWDAQTGERHRLAPWSSAPRFSPDGKFLVGSFPDPLSKDQKGFLWALQNVATGEIVASVPSEKKGDIDLAVHGFSADGSKIFAAFAKGRAGPAIVRILDGKTLKTLHEFQPKLSTHLYSVADDCSLIVCINQEKKIEVWNVLTGRIERTLDFPGLEKVGAVRLFMSPDKRYLAFGYGNMNLEKMQDLRTANAIPTDLGQWSLFLVDLSGAQGAKKISIPPGPFRELAFSPDSKTLAMAMHGKVYLFDLPQ